jgi:TonB family protein
MFIDNEAAWFSLFLSAAIKSTALLGVAWIQAFLLRRRSSAARHLIWTAAAAAVLALPFLSASLPALRIPVAAAWLPASQGPVFQSAVSQSADGGASQPLVNGRGTHAPERALWRPRWRMALMFLWAAGATLVFAQMLVALAVMYRVRRAARSFADGGLGRALSRALGIRQPVDVLEAPAGSMPMTFGVLRAAVFMPSDAAQWSDERLRLVLMHELAHVRRGDAATQLLARLALAVHWWNPLAWTAWREFMKERERAADDLVLNAGAAATEYAGHLLEVARTRKTAPLFQAAAIAMARKSQLEGRLIAILDGAVNRKTPGHAAALVAALLAVGIIAPLAAVRAQQVQPQWTVPADVDAAIRAATAQKNYEMLEGPARAAEELVKYDTAQKLLESALAIRGEVSGRQSVDYGVGLLNLGDLAKRQHSEDSAVTFYAQAAEVLGERPEAARALTYLGVISVKNKDFPQALVYFQQALRADPARSGSAQTWMALTQERAQNLDEADRLYQSALSSQDPQSLEAAITMEVYARLLRQQGRAEQANDLEARAAAIHKALARPAPAPTEGVYRIGADITPPAVLEKVEPQYTEEARVARIQGTTVLSVEIGPDGVARNAQVLRGVGLGLDESALIAISQWRFKPGAKNGQPVTVKASIEVNFRLL